MIYNYQFTIWDLNNIIILIILDTMSSKTPIVDTKTPEVITHMIDKTKIEFSSKLD